MRPNPVKQKLLEGSPSFGTFVGEFFTPGVPAILKAAGAEFVIYDMEHSGATIETLKQQAAYCRGIGLIPLARPPNADYDYIARLLDIGMMGVEVPMVETREQAEHIVSCCRYPPEGVRGASFGGSAHDDYLGGNIAELIAAAHRRTLIICLIETEKGIQNIDAIASVPGIDVCYLGHVDLTINMGIPGDFEHPRYLAAVSQLQHACRKHGKVPGTTALDQQWGDDYFDKGFRMICYASDTRLLKVGLREGLDRLRARR